MADFLKRDVKTPFRAAFIAAGAVVRIETNSQAILEAARRNFEPAGRDPEEICLKLWVEDGDYPSDGMSKPYFRGLGHLVFSGYSERSSLVINLRERYGAGRLTQALAETTDFWKTVFFPSVLGIVGPSVGLASVHAACIATEEDGLLLAGKTCSGKSVLSLALALGGMDYLADDRTLVSHKGGELRAWGTSADMKQRAEAAAHFPELKALTPGDTFKGELAFRFDPARLFNVTRARSCKPAWIVFLEPQSEPCFDLEEVSSGEAASRLSDDLHQQPVNAAESQRLIVDAISRKACFVLRYAGDPHAIAEALSKAVLGRRRPDARACPPVTGNRTHPSPPARDPLRRFRATRLRTGARVMGRHIRIETDNPSVLRRVSEIFGRPETVPPDAPRFLWRIVCESPDDAVASWPPMIGFSDRGLRYVNLGQRGFLAADLVAREAVGSLPESLCDDEIGFSTVFLAGMLHLTAPALGLTAVSAACVARGSSGLLLFGPPNSGKTTVSYAARKLGLDFHADQATFLELDRDTLWAWGDFWPAAFRAETARFLPELATEGRAFRYGDRSFLCIDKVSPPSTTRAKIPVAACVFLDRQPASAPRLVPLSRAELAGQVITEAGSHEERGAAIGLLGKLPAYRLVYRDDPGSAARLVRGVLDAEQMMECRA